MKGHVIVCDDAPVVRCTFTQLLRHGQSLLLPQFDSQLRVGALLDAPPREKMFGCQHQNGGRKQRGPVYKPDSSKRPRCREVI
eukprot:1188401-Prorocentrum_minimum.AAC.8